MVIVRPTIHRGLAPLNADVESGPAENPSGPALRESDCSERRRGGQCQHDRAYRTSETWRFQQGFRGEDSSEETRREAGHAAAKASREDAT